MSSALHAHNKVVMSKIGKNGRKELYNHSKFIMLRGKQMKNASIKLISETGLFIMAEDGLIFEVERFWGEMFCLNGNANLNIGKLMVDGGRKYGGEHISMTEHENAIKDMKEKKATDGSKRHSIQAVELSQWFQAAVQIVSNLPAPSNGGPIYRFLGMPAMRTRWMAGAAAHKSG